MVLDFIEILKVILSKPCFISLALKSAFSFSIPYEMHL